MWLLTLLWKNLLDALALTRWTIDCDKISKYLFYVVNNLVPNLYFVKTSNYLNKQNCQPFKISNNHNNICIEAI